MAMSVYERGVAECPTVESLWVSYLHQLLYLTEKYQRRPDPPQHNPVEFLNRAKEVAERACRNCPYSVRLIQYKLNITVLLANRKLTVFDPEEQLFETVKTALHARFITSSGEVTELCLTIFQVLRRRILFLLATMTLTAVPEDRKKKNKKKKPPQGNNQNETDECSPRRLPYDDAEPVGSTTTTTTTTTTETDEVWTELDDLCTDCRELYDDVDEYLRKNHSQYGGHARARLWKDRGWTEWHLLCPLLQCLNHDEGGGHNDTNAMTITHFTEVTRSYDHSAKASQPVHPNIYRDYIQAMFTCFPTSCPSHVISKLRQVRSLYQTALTKVGKPKDAPSTSSIATTGIPSNNTNELDYETSLRCLCHDYMTFESYFGSDQSHSSAFKAVSKKLSRIYESTPDAVAVADNSTLSLWKRTADHEDGSNGPATKKQKTTAAAVDDGPPEEEEPIHRTTLAKPKDTTHKVKVGNLEYPAHPYTIKVSYLSTQTEDMDLVDVFRPKCGPVVHAKIMREKHPAGPHEKGKSKGWALVQFEDRESVEKALALSDVIGIHNKSVRIERSHLPAVSLVPPGMHRVNPKGHGKSTKRNQKKKGHHQQDGGGGGGGDDDNDDNAPTGSAIPTSQAETGTKVESSPSAAAAVGSPKGGGAGGGAGGSATPASVLAFRPRGVKISKADKRKARISLSDTTSTTK
jgi:hypothetical protein